MFTEYRNIMNQTLSRSARHINYITDIKLPSCAFVVSLPPEERCEYVLGKKECHEDEYFVSYINFFYCVLDSGQVLHRIIGHCALFVGMCFLFLLLGTTSSLIFCPSLKVISDILSLNENVAGVTLLAFGNCAPDVITGLSAVMSDNRVIYTDFLGAVIFVSFFVGGLIISVCPCVVIGSTFLRDILFLCFALNYVHNVYDTNYSVTLAEALGIVSIYIFYIVVVVTDQILSKKYIEKRIQRSTVHFELQSTQAENKVNISDDSEENLYGMESNDEDQNAIPPKATNQMYKEEPQKKSKPGQICKELLKQFLSSINPIHMEEWIVGKKFDRALLILKAPIVFCLRLLIPLVDYDLELHGWSRLLNSIQIIIVPTAILGIGAPHVKISGIPLYALVCAISAPFALLVFIITDHKKIPKYFKFFAILSAVGSMYVIFASAQGVVSILTVVGIITYRSTSFLGCTLLAWGNSLGDMVVNLTLARQGYEKMSLSACVGGPLFNVLMGIGLSTSLLAARSPNYKTDIYKFGDGLMGLNLNIQLVMGLIILAFATSFTNFVLRRSIGILMILFYVIYFIMAVGIELEFIHPFGCAHRLGEEIEDAYQG